MQSANPVYVGLCRKITTCILCNSFCVSFMYLPVYAAYSVKATAISNHDLLRFRYKRMGSFRTRSILL